MCGGGDVFIEMKAVFDESVSSSIPICINTTFDIEHFSTSLPKLQK